MMLWIGVIFQWRAHQTWTTIFTRVLRLGFCKMLLCFLIISRIHR